jgi:hypothetical protein
LFLECRDGAEGWIRARWNCREFGWVVVGDFIDAEDGEAHGCSDAYAEQDLGRSWYLVVGADRLDLRRGEPLSGELANAIDEDGNRLIEAFVAGALAAGGFDVGGRGPKECIGSWFEGCGG